MSKEAFGGYDFAVTSAPRLFCYATMCAMRQDPSSSVCAVFLAHSALEAFANEIGVLSKQWRSAPAKFYSAWWDQIESSNGPLTLKLQALHQAVHDGPFETGSGPLQGLLVLKTLRDKLTHPKLDRGKHVDRGRDWPKFVDGIFSRVPGLRDALKADPGDGKPRSLIEIAEFGGVANWACDVSRSVVESFVPCAEWRLLEVCVEWFLRSDQRSLESLPDPLNSGSTHGLDGLLGQDLEQGL